VAVMPPLPPPPPLTLMLNGRSYPSSVVGPIFLFFPLSEILGHTPALLLSKEQVRCPFSLFPIPLFSQIRFFHAFWDKRSDFRRVGNPAFFSPEDSFFPRPRKEEARSGDHMIVPFLFPFPSYSAVVDPCHSPFSRTCRLPVCLYWWWSRRTSFFEKKAQLSFFFPHSTLDLREGPTRVFFF